MTRFYAPFGATRDQDRADQSQSTKVLGPSGGSPSRAGAAPGLYSARLTTLAKPIQLN
jgi:hypothetical protein